MNNVKVSKYRLSTKIKSYITIAEQLLALLKQPTAIDQVASIASELSQAQDFGLEYQVPFYDILLYAGFLQDERDGRGNSFVKEMRGRYAKSLRQQLKDIKRLFNPEVTGKDKEVLENNTFPMLQEMVHATPEERPGLFEGMCRRVIDLVGEGKLGMYAAAQETGYALDRPEIIESVRLREVVKAAHALELPGLLNGGDAKQRWSSFVEAVESVPE